MEEKILNFQQKLEKAIDAIVPDSMIKLETIEDGKVGGTIISNYFEEMAQLDRQNFVWDNLETVLSKEETDKIVLLLTFTRDEWNNLPYKSMNMRRF
jgi:acid stress-induced BolA-like protein IbaG/YrbA